MPVQIIKARPDFIQNITSVDLLEISEFFYDTIQGENFVGYPATFLRLQHCTLNCSFCDTQEVWRFGNPYSFEELFKLIEEHSLVERFKRGQHLVLTGGSPLKQQYKLMQFLQQFISKYGFKPYIEIENECTIMPTMDFCSLIDCWNNSPKLEGSGNFERNRYKPDVISALAKLPNSWFKFVISDEREWEEIETKFLNRGLIQYDQIVLMPLGETKQELEHNREMVIDLAIKHNVRYTDRHHITVWDKKTGV